MVGILCPLYQRRRFSCLGLGLAWGRGGHGAICFFRDEYLVKVLAQHTRPESLPQTQCPLLPVPWGLWQATCRALSPACIYFLLQSSGEGRLVGEAGAPFSGVAVTGVPSATCLEDGWAGQTNCPLVTPDPFSRFTFSIHKGLKTMDFHFACCTCNLTKHPPGRGCQQPAARPAR